MKKGFCYHIIIFLLFLVNSGASAQYIQVDDNYTAQQLVDALVSGGCAQVSNVTVNGWAGGSGGPSFGYFTENGSGFPFQNGIVLSTGFAMSAPGPNSSLLSQGGSGWNGDADLEAAISVSGTVNATVLEFDFVPYTSSISFDYIFASEQYLTSINSPNQCNYTDGFAFLLKEAGSSGGYQNLAVIPGTSTPVKVNTVRGQGVCPAANPQYFAQFNPNNSPINFNGQTVILTAQANVTPGTTYHIKLVVADQGNGLYDSAIFLGGGSFSSVTNLGADRLVATGNALCNGQSLPLDATVPVPGATYRWLRNGGQVATTPMYTITQPGDYEVEIVLAPGCTGGDQIKIEYNPPIPAGNYTLLQCDDNNDGRTLYDLGRAGELARNGDNTLTPTYYFTAADAAVPQNALDANTPFANTTPNQNIYVRLQNSAGCSAVATVTLGTSNNTVNNPQPLEECDVVGPEDGMTEFDLTQRDAQILAGMPAGLQLQYYALYNDALTETNAIPNPAAFTNTTAGTQTVYARIYNASDCYGIARLQLNVFTFGGALQDEAVTLCAGTPSITLTAPSGYNNYQWNTTPATTGQSLSVNVPGTYTVSLENANSCVGTKTYNVSASGAATGANVDVVEFAGNNNSLTIIPQGIGSYEYSLDGITYQPENYFGGLAPGEYDVYILDINGCGPPYKTSAYILDYPRFFTPNGDGINDYWRLPLMNFQPKIEITIFDRFGKLITGFRGNSLGWDGKLNGSPLPATDYWFVIQMPNGRIIKGHFSLLR
ncbi:MAG: choice-of-anchor L domain-containing protein [Flavobacterium sp.]